MKVTRIDHVAILVQDLDAMLNLLDGFDLALGSSEDVPEFGARSNIVPVGNADIELLDVNNPAGECARTLETRGAGLHHICLEVDSLEEAVDELTRRGLQLVNTEPFTDSTGKRVWLHPKSGQGVLFGIVERHKTAGQSRT